MIKFIRALRKLLHIPGFGFLRYLLRPVARSYLVKHKNEHIFDEIDGVRFKLDLAELIDRSLYWKGCFEPVTHQRLNELCKPGWHVLDIGANMGAHCLFMAKSVGMNGRVDAFEPASYVYNKLKYNAELNNLPQLHLHHVGTSDVSVECLKTKVYCSWPVDKTGVEDQVKSIPNVKVLDDEIKLVRLDDYLDKFEPERIDLVKIDIDGNEIKFLSGGDETFKRFLPIIVFEAIDGPLRSNDSSLEEYFNKLQELNYIFYHEDTLEELSTQFRNRLSSEPGLSVNLLAFQRSEKHQKILQSLTPVKSDIPEV